MSQVKFSKLSHPCSRKPLWLSPVVTLFGQEHVALIHVSMQPFFYFVGFFVMVWLVKFAPAKMEPAGWLVHGSATYQTIIEGGKLERTAGICNIPEPNTGHKNCLKKPAEWYPNLHIPKCWTRPWDEKGHHRHFNSLYQEISYVTVTVRMNSSKPNRL